MQSDKDVEGLRSETTASVVGVMQPEFLECDGSSSEQGGSSMNSGTSDARKIQELGANEVEGENIIPQVLPTMYTTREGVDGLLWTVPEVFTNSESPVLDIPIINAKLGAIGPSTLSTGSTTKIIMYRGIRRKIHMLDEVIRNVQSAAKVLAAAQHKNKGRGKPRKSSVALLGRISTASLSGVVDILISDSDFIHRQEAILREEKVTVSLGKLIGATAIANEDVIIKVIA
ncbi:hypothetical protein V6N12_065560 [Hibiscus sabdariffa]|uniref:Uncharacterized protein n=1 Tax=Hibiscus sabdariffa TaxID=183260 RepID=A0ABR2G928_9ROSI